MPSWSWHKTSFLNVQEIDTNSFKSPIRLNRLNPLAWEWRPSDSCQPYYRLIFTAKWAKIVWFCGVGSWQQWYVGISWVQAPPTSDSPLTIAALSLSHSDAPWVYKKQTQHWQNTCVYNSSQTLAQVLAQVLEGHCPPIKSHSRCTYSITILTVLGLYND